MGQPDQEVSQYFSQPVRQITLMVMVLGLVGFGGYVALPRVLPVFLANPYLNGFIGFVFVIGVVACFWQVLQLVGSVNWIERFIGVRPRQEGKRAPRLLAPLAGLMRERGAQSQISSSSSRSILDSVATRIDEARDITRYISNLLIFLGLLGTFYGLATTVPALVDTIRALSPQEGEGASVVFTRLMTGLEQQLGGMGTAFASSLLGLAGSLVVGLLELFASHGQNRFFRELEEWMSSITRIGFSSGDGDGEMSGAAAVLDHMSLQMEGLQNLFVQSDVSRSLIDDRIDQLSKSIDRMVLRMENDGGTGPALEKIAITQERLVSVLEKNAKSETQGDLGDDAESRMRLRSIDVQLLRILEELSAGRQESTTALRGEISALTRALRDIAGQEQ
ncbi:biopolymer transporter ExbB [Pacificibacter sp. AS14]|uniref:biopolymer transporter ExbB n=1 Tax=Pacificibacter sp. AS14 TaxID=3135785 RepID=UPI0031779DA2